MKLTSVQKRKSKKLFTILLGILVFWILLVLNNRMSSPIVKYKTSNFLILPILIAVTVVSFLIASLFGWLGWLIAAVILAIVWVKWYRDTLMVKLPDNNQEVLDASLEDAKEATVEVAFNPETDSVMFG